MKRAFTLLALMALGPGLGGCVAAIPVATGLLVGESALSRDKGEDPRVAAVGPPPFERAQPITPAAPELEPVALGETPLVEDAPAPGATRAELPAAIEEVEVAASSAPVSAPVAVSPGAMAAVVRTADVGPIGPADAGEMAYDAMFARVTRVAQRDPKSREKRVSALLRAPGRLEPDRVECGNSQTALLIDLDPAEGAAPLDEGIVATERLRRILAAVRDQDVAILWLSKHPAESTDAVRRTLAQSGLDPTGADELYLPRSIYETKATRREDAARIYCIVAILGDEWQDFDTVFQTTEEPASAAAALDLLMDEAWFLGPAPLNPKG